MPIHDIFGSSVISSLKKYGLISYFCEVMERNMNIANNNLVDDLVKGIAGFHFWNKVIFSRCTYTRDY